MAISSSVTNIPDPESYYAWSPYDFGMASPSSEKITERQPQPQSGAGAGAAAAKAGQQMNKGKGDLHVALPADLIEKLKGAPNWGDRFRWTYDEEKVRRVWETQQSMDFDDLVRHVMYGDGTEVVWEHDIWNLQRIVRPQAAKCTATKDDDGDDGGGGDEDDEEPRSPMADKPNKDAD